MPWEESPRVTTCTPTLCWRLIEDDKKGNWLTLVHGMYDPVSQKRTRILPWDRWIFAERKLEWTNPKATRKSRSFITGFHVFVSKEEATKYLERFNLKKRDIRVVACLCRRLVRKHPPGAVGAPIYLAQEMLIPWKTRPEDYLNEPEQTLDTRGTLPPSDRPDALKS